MISPVIFLSPRARVTARGLRFVAMGGLAALGLAAAPAPMAGAFTLGGAVVADTGGGAFVKLDPSERFAVGDDTFQDPNLYAFDEDQNIVLDRDLRVDIGAAGRVIPAGSVIASHYVFFDPGFGQWQAGFVEFDAPILGVAIHQSTLAATDFLANTSVTYLNPVLRGLEPDDAVWIDPEDPTRLNVRWVASSPGDYVRVFTAASPSA